MTDHDASNEAGSGPPEPDKASKGAREAAWDDVAAHFSRLGQQVRERFERPAGEAAGATETPSDAPSTRETPSGDTVRRWIDKLDETFTRLGDTVRDPAFRQEAGASVGRLGEALGVTLREAGEQLQGRFGRTRTETAPGEPMPDVPPPPSPAPPENTSSSPDTPSTDAESDSPDDQAPPA
jgi:hypothetical protein